MPSFYNFRENGLDYSFDDIFVPADIFRDVSSGNLWTWGYQNHGNAVGNTVSTPVTTFSGGPDWKQVSGGFGFMVAVKIDGTLWTWGFQSGGQLGNGVTTTGEILTPITTFAGGTNWKQVSAGSDHTAAIKTDGTLWTWGNGVYGQLGTNDTTKRSTPVTTFTGGTDWKQASAGKRYTAAIKTDGTLWTWGYGSFGQLGKDPLSYQIVGNPITTFAGGTNWKSTEPEFYTLSAGKNYTTAIKTDGTLWIWGNGTYGRLGNAVTTNVSTPITTFAGGTDWKQVSTSSTSTNDEEAHTTAIKTDGTLWIWGNGTYGRLGNAVTTDVSTPVTIFAGGTNWKQVSAGSDHTAAIKTDGTLWTWGRGDNRQLGNAVTTNTSTPVTTFAGGTDWKQVSSGRYHTSAIKTDGTLWVWGTEFGGQLGTNFGSNASTPVTTFAGGTNWKQVSAAYQHTAAIKTDGTLWIWGTNNVGELGNNSNISEGVPVTTFAGGTDWKQVSCGSILSGVNQGFTAAVKNDGTLWTWGSNISGQLGTNNTTNTNTPVTTFAGGTNWREVYCGDRHIIALRDDGVDREIFTWGFGFSGQLGNGNTTDTSTPVTTFAGGTSWADVEKDFYIISAGTRFNTAIKTDGTLWTWGYGSNGYLGNADTTNRSTPITTFSGGTNWKQISSGNVNTAAIKTDGTLWVWGYNGINPEGLLGINSLGGSRSTPVTTFAGGTNWKQVSAGYPTTAAIKTDGTLWVWGNGNKGRLGNAVTTNSRTPVTTFAGGTDWKQVSCGFDHTAAVKTDGTLWVWGNGGNGRLGNATTTTTNSTPITTFTGGTDWKQVSSGRYHTSAIKTDGTLWTWGLGTLGRLGNAVTIGNISTPVTTFAGGTNWKQVSAGDAHTAAVKTDGTLWLWGNGGSGRLGNNIFNYYNVPVSNPPTYAFTPVTTFIGGTDWKQVSSGRDNTIALRDDGFNKELFVWGTNDKGQLGNTYNEASNWVPSKVFGEGTDWKQVDCGYHITSTVKTDGTLWIWGRAHGGGLGIGDDLFFNKITPVTTFIGGTNWKQVSVGGYDTVEAIVSAIKKDGTLWVWGNTAGGVLGNGMVDFGPEFISEFISTPVTTFSGGSNWKYVSSGGYHRVTIKTDGTLWTWGLNYTGQLGNATFDSVSTPITTFAGGTNWKQIDVSFGYNSSAITYIDPVL